jgi:hypothetical protein
LNGLVTLPLEHLHFAVEIDVSKLELFNACKQMAVVSDIGVQRFGSLFHNVEQTTDLQEISVV